MYSVYCKTMFHYLLFALWFLLPAAAANVAPILSTKLPGLSHWNAPLDGNKKFCGKHIFGPHKTWRGIVSGMVVATIVFGLEHLLISYYGWAQLLIKGVNYHHLPVLILGPLFGLGALGGDAIESFFKRQNNIPSGYSWIPYDQLDYVVGGILVTLPFVILSALQYVWIIAVWFVMHLLASYVGWLIHLKERPI
jgi:CDP-2,3-bis-(O-geranylgeranyl)-sn-glycerol synthase